MQCSGEWQGPGLRLKLVQCSAFWCTPEDKHMAQQIQRRLKQLQENVYRSGYVSRFCQRGDLLYKVVCSALHREEVQFCTACCAFSTCTLYNDTYFVTGILFVFVQGYCSILQLLLEMHTSQDRASSLHKILFLQQFLLCKGVLQNARCSGQRCVFAQSTF